MYTRRDFIKTIGAVGAIFLTPLSKIVIRSPHSFLVDKPEGELYEGFLLLEYEAGLPSFVDVAPCPILGPIEASDEYDSNVTAYRGVETWFDDIESMESDINFSFFMLDQLPERVKFLHGYIIRFEGSREIWEVRIDYGFEETGEQVISLTASPVFSNPYPVWPLLVEPVKDNGKPILDDEFILERPKKVNISSRRGIMLSTFQGFMLQWIESGVLYTVFMDYGEWREKPDDLIKSLRKK